MRFIFSIFSKSPFIHLELHMRQVSSCIQNLHKMIPPLLERDYELLELIADKISELKEISDIAFKKIYNETHPKMIFPINKRRLLRCITMQNKIAEQTEKLSILFLSFPPQKYGVFEQHFENFFLRNILPFYRVLSLILELQELQTASFGGSEAKKVILMLESVVLMVNELKLDMRDILKKLYRDSQPIDAITVNAWYNIILEVNPIASFSKEIANTIKMMLET